MSATGTEGGAEKAAAFGIDIQKMEIEEVTSFGKVILLFSNDRNYRRRSRVEEQPTTLADLLTTEDLREALVCTKMGNATGPNEIPVEVIRHTATDNTD